MYVRLLNSSSKLSSDFIWQIWNKSKHRTSAITELLRCLQNNPAWDSFHCRTRHRNQYGWGSWPLTPAALAPTRVESSLCLAALMLQLKNQILYCSVPLSLNSRRWRLAATCSARRTPPLRFSFHHHLPVGIGRCGGNSHYTLLIEVVISVVQHEQTERTNGFKIEKCGRTQQRFLAGHCGRGQPGLAPPTRTPSKLYFLLDRHLSLWNKAQGMMEHFGWGTGSCCSCLRLSSSFIPSTQCLD